MKRIFLAVFLLLAFTVSLHAYENSGSVRSYSLYAGFETWSIPPKDFGSIGSLVDLHIALGQIAPALPPVSLGVNWRQAKTIFRFQSEPTVEYIGLSVIIPIIQSYQNDNPFLRYRLTGEAGTSLILQHVSQNYGLSFDAGVSAYWRPLTWLELSLPVNMKFMRDGAQGTFEIGARGLIPPIFTGLYISWGMMFNTLYDFSETGYNTFVKIQLGGEIQ